MSKEYDLSKIEFKGRKKFLSNMYPAPIVFSLEDEIGRNSFPFVFDGLQYQSSEHLYQSLKSNDPEWKALVLATQDGEKVKVLARKHLDKTYMMREDWDEVKLDAMRIAVLLKFEQNKKLEDKLLAVEGEIVEHNCWGDTFWGKVDNIGENNLGKILTKHRDMIKMMGNILRSPKNNLITKIGKSI